MDVADFYTGTAAINTGRDFDFGHSRSTIWGAQMFELGSVFGILSHLGALLLLLSTLAGGSRALHALALAARNSSSITSSKVSPE